MNWTPPPNQAPPPNFPIMKQTPPTPMDQRLPSWLQPVTHDTGQTWHPQTMFGGRPMPRQS